MITLMSRAFAGLFQTGDSTVAVPSMDGAMRPNHLIDQAQEIVAIDSPDNLFQIDQRIYFTSGSAVYELPEGDSKPREAWAFDVGVSCAAAAPGGGLAVGLEDGTVRIAGGNHEGWSLSTLDGRKTVCPTAMAVINQRTLAICLGSARNSPREWRRDLLEHGRTGSVWRVDVETGKATCLADGLSYPYGLMATDGMLVVSESWRHRLIGIKESEAPKTLLDELPGYPARLVATQGGAWLAVFAPRREMIEFVLQETAFRQRMMREINEKYWMAPALSSGTDYLEPLMGGAVKQLGILKPWAPTQSYGLVVRLDSDFRPIASYHSRGDGTRHGVTSCLETPDGLLFSSRGGNVICQIERSVIDAGAI